MESQWQNKKVIENLKYLEIKPIDLNLKFYKSIVNYLKNLNLKEYKILDFGCGNGRIFLSFEKDLKKKITYVGFDCNKYLIEIAKKHFKQNNNVSFFYKNIDKVTFDDLLPYKNWIFLFDSTFSMIENPKRMLNIIKNLTSNIILSRTLIIRLNTLKIFFNKELQDGCVNVPFKWPGMEKKSPRWKFSYKFLQDISNLKIHESSSILYENPVCFLGPSYMMVNIFLCPK